MIFEREKLHYRTLYFSLRIVKSLQLRGSKQIIEPRKYYLVYDYFSLAHIFLLFLYVFPSGIAQCEDDNIKYEKKNKRTTKCDKSIVTYDVDSAQCEDETIKYEGKKKEP